MRGADAYISVHAADLEAHLVYLKDVSAHFKGVYVFLNTIRAYIVI